MWENTEGLVLIYGRALERRQMVSKMEEVGRVQLTMT